MTDEGARTSPVHYQLLADYHARAHLAALSLERALEVKLKAEADIIEARKALESAQSLIRKYYTEPPLA